MKNLCLLFILFISSAVGAQEISMTALGFRGGEQNYAEIHLFVMGSSVQFVSNKVDTTQRQAAVEVLMLIRQDTQIVQFEKYKLNSPLSASEVNFVDVKRFGLKNGVYEVEVQVRDVHQPEKTATVKQDLLIDYNAMDLALSDIQLVSSLREDSTASPLNKNGIYLETLPFQFYNRQSRKLIFYTELYHSDIAIGKDYALHYRVELIYTNGRKKTMMQRTMRKKPASVVPILIQNKIDDLPSGNYQLVVEIQNREKEILTSRSVKFQNSNPNVSLLVRNKEVRTENTFVDKLTKEELYYSLKAIVPVIERSNATSLNYIISNGTPLQQKQALYGYWAGQHKSHPEQLYNAYMEVARAVDKQYHSGLGDGFESDRGYVFLKYGRPDDITTVEDEPSAPPYEIWSYNQFPATSQHNVKFLFYNPTLAIGQFQLLHSTARGELNNPQWELELYRDDGSGSLQGSDFDSTTAPDNVGRRARRYFNDF